MRLFKLLFFTHFLLYLSSALAEEKFTRILRDEHNAPVELQTEIVHLISKSDPQIKVDLIGAVHVGDASYYRLLDEKFTHYDSLLYELIAEKDAVINKKRSLSGISVIQLSLKELLQLEFQLDSINYQAPNFIHADLTSQEFTNSMQQRGESFTTMLYTLVMSEQNKQVDDPTKSEATSLKLLLSIISPKRSLIMKRVLAEQFVDMDYLMSMFVEEKGSTILTVRNDKALSVLQSELKKGNKHLGIFYGAAHLPDLEKKLVQNIGFVRSSQEWVSAWNLAK